MQAILVATGRVVSKSQAFTGALLLAPGVCGSLTPISRSSVRRSRTVSSRLVSGDPIEFGDDDRRKCCLKAAAGLPKAYDGLRGVAVAHMFPARRPNELGELSDAFWIFGKFPSEIGRG